MVNIKKLFKMMTVPFILALLAECGTARLDDIYYSPKNAVVNKRGINEPAKQLMAQTQKPIAEETINTSAQVNKVTSAVSGDGATKTEVAEKTINSSTQINEVTLTVSGDGKTKDDATAIALRSAIEQTFGTFVSANTTILNDELVKDEIATVASGNIRKYSEIASVPLSNGNISVTLQATVSVSKLVSYAQSKGSSIEFAGATFAANIKLKELNRVNEYKALENMVVQLKALMPTMFDYKLVLGEPKLPSHRYYDDDGDYYVIDAKVSVCDNENTRIANSILLKTLSSLSLTESERMEYSKLNIPYRKLTINGENQDKNVVFYLRSSPPISPIVRGFRNAIYGFKITDNLQGISMIKMIREDNYISQGLISSYRPSDEFDKEIFGGYYSGELCFSHILNVENCRYGGEYNYNRTSYRRNGCYVVNFILKIPKEDISKYTNFTISRK
jgi:hypothetical protein